MKLLANASIRDAATADLTAVRRLLDDARLPIDGLEEFFHDGYAVAEVNGEVIGAEGIEVYGDVGLLRSAVVRPAWRGRGVGERLTLDRIAWAHRRGLKELYLLTTTAADYFPRFGFEQVERSSAPAAIRRSREFSEACPATAIFMQLHLLSEN